MISRLHPDAISGLAEQLGQVRGRARAALKREFSEQHGVSPSSLSRALANIGLRCHERSDRGARRKKVDVLDALAALQRKSHSLRKGVVMPAEDAINIAEDSGMIAPGAVSTSYYNAWLREQQASRTDQERQEPHVELRSLGPNHVHQVDFSLAVNWKIANNKPIYEHLIYQNKLPEGGTPRLLRLLVVDHTTGVFFPYYFAALGESAVLLLEGLYRAWAPKPEVQEIYPFRGVPRILMVDRGQGTKSQVTVELLKHLDVQLNVCQGARAKGSVEVSHRFWEEHFESRFRLQTPGSVEQLNAWALDFAIRICAEKAHSRHGAFRSQLWNWHIGRRTETALRELRCSLDEFKAICLTTPQRCLVGGSRIVRFKGQKYRAPEQIMPGARVEVHYSPFDYPRISMRLADSPSAQAWMCDPVQVDEFGFATTAAVIGEQYRAEKHSATKRFVKAANAAGDELIASNTLRVFGHHSANVAPVAGNPSSEEVPLEPAAPEFLTRVQARAAVLDLIGRPFTPAEADYLNRSFGDAVTEEQISAAVQQIQQGVAARVIAFGGER